MSAPALGILQLQTRFLRPPGDISHRDSWPFPIKVAVVKNASMDMVFSGQWGEDLVMAFVREGRRLIEEEGCIALVTSCGFLATMHPLLAHQLPSIGTSALLQLPMVTTLYPAPGSVGVITFDAARLTIKHFMSVGASPQTPVAGLPEGGIFRRVIASEIPYDHEGMRDEVLEAGRELKRTCEAKGGELRAVVLECTNMPPFAANVARELNVAVYDILTLGRFIYSGALTSKDDYEFRLPSPPRGL